MKQTLPGIQKIGFIGRDNLQKDIVWKVKAGKQIVITQNVNFLCIVGTAIATVEDYQDNNIYVEKVTLKFQTSEEVKFVRKAVIIQTVEGKWYIIGAKEMPFPIISSECSTGQPDGEPAVKEITVKLTCEKALIPCVIM